MAIARTPPDRWVEQALNALADGGPQAVRVEQLAQALGVSKGGFYWHFENREALLEAMLKRWEREGVEEVIRQVESGGGDARDKLRRLFTMASERRDPLRADLAVRDWARHDAGVAESLRRVDNRRMEYLREKFGEIYPDDEDEVETRCLMVSALWIGSNFLAAEHGVRSRADVLESALEHLLR